MSKHTPGPWYKDTNGRIWRRHPSELYENGGGVAGDIPVATVWEGWYGEDLVGFPVEANARLIASAPELLEALQDAIALYGKFGAIVNDPHNPGEWITKAQEAVRRATE